MKIEELFKSKMKKGDIAKEWEKAERGKDPLVQFWKERKRQQSICNVKRHKSTA